MSSTYLTIAGMAVATYLARAGGVWLMRFVTPGPRLDAWLRHVPGAVLVALVVPSALDSGAYGVLGVGLTAAIAWRTRNVLAAMVAGVAVVWALRTFG